jgi:hypothetical protein
MYNNQGSQRHPSEASPCSDLRDNPPRDNEAAYGSTPRMPGISNAFGRLDAPDDDAFEFGLMRGGSMYDRQNSLREVRVYISRVKSARLNAPVVPI